MQITLANPRGFCAGVSRAVEIVEQSLDIFEPPVYVKHEIIHNQQVVAELRSRGAVFVEDLSEVPNGSVLIFSAHGVPPSDRAAAQARGLRVIDATCPLVTKVHLEAIRYARRGYHVLYIGHRGHPEPIGTLGEIEPHQGTLIETVGEADSVAVPDPDRVVVLTQTTLSVQDTQVILDRLRSRFPRLELPPKEDICYATSNRQAAVAELSGDSDLVLVVGSHNSSNSNRLVEVARARSRPAYLVQDPEEIEPAWLEGVQSVAVSSGASAPEYLVSATVARLRELGAAEVQERHVIDEHVTFPLPRELLEAGQGPHLQPPPPNLGEGARGWGRERAVATRTPKDAEDSSSHRERGDFSGAHKRRSGPYSSARCAAAPPPELLKGIAEFNTGEFFEQHETLELLWRATDDDVRYLYQGILLVGVGFYHLGRGNYHGARSKLSAGIEMLRWFGPTCQTVDVADLIGKAERCLAHLLVLGAGRCGEFDRSIIPRIRMKNEDEE